MPKTSKVAGKTGVDTHSVGVKVLGDDERVFRHFMCDIFAAAATMQTLRRLSQAQFQNRASAGSPTACPQGSIGKASLDQSGFRAKWVPVRGSFAEEGFLF
jgi:hypothetical protein